MRLNINDLLDDWFLSLSENPDKLDKVIKNYETARMACLICLISVLAIFLFIIVTSENNLADGGFMFGLVVFMLVLNFQTDIFTKVLKIQRQNHKKQ